MRNGKLRRCGGNTEPYHGPAMLATKLRLTPQSRTDPKTIARMQQNGTAPWHQGERSEEDESSW
jgi:hypothetical protein